MPASLAEAWIDLVFAVRQPLSAPTWAKPMVMSSEPPEPPEPPSLLLPPQAARPLARTTPALTVMSFLNTVSSIWDGTPQVTRLRESQDTRGRTSARVLEALPRIEVRPRC